MKKVAQPEHLPFRDPPPIELDFGHQDLKHPESHGDSRYLALANDLKEQLIDGFTEICERYLYGEDHDRITAQHEFEAKYEQLLQRRFLRAGARPDKNPALYEYYVHAVMQDCLSLRRPPFDAANRAISILRKLGFLPRAH